MSDDALDPASALPPDVLAAATTALAGEAAERQAAFEAVCRAHPGHAEALQRLHDDLLAMERLLGGDGEPGAVLPQQIGPYRVLRRLGGGAFGEVYRCEQDEPVRREVAVKVLRAGAGDRTTLLRFAAERQLIASLQHPAIAQVFDAGTLADGRPFFVMDAIDGQPIDCYCDEHALTVDARLELFSELCRGVQHAHERGIVHRDLKPANVLVVEIDGRPRPKIIDFGIAKALHGSRVQRSFDTEAGRVIGTPGYMSPEQQRGSSDDVDARADVFGLGVMLYELLCGQLPWAVGAADTATDARRPSTRVGATEASAAAIAHRRSTEPRRLASRLRGELDWIVLMCLQRDPVLRYQTANQLIDDLERHRRSEPVLARPPATSYRLKKFVQRHRIAATALAVVAAATILVLFLAQEYRRSFVVEIDAATARADAGYAAAAGAVAALVERANDPAVRDAPQGDAVRAAMLGDALAFYERFLRDRPGEPALLAERCRALLGMTQVCWLLGDSSRATDFALQAIQDGEAAYAADRANVERRGMLGEARCRHGLARALAGDHGGASTSLQEAVAHLAAAAAAWPARFARLHVIALRNAATSLPPQASGDRIAALRTALAAADSLRKVAPPVADAETEFVVTCCELASELRIAHLHTEAAAVLQPAAAALPEVTSDRHHVAWRVSWLRASVAFDAGERPLGIEHLESALATADAWEREWPDRLPPKATKCRTLRGLGFMRNYVGDFARSEEDFRAAITIGEALLGRSPGDASRARELIVVLEEYVMTLFDRGRRGVLAEAVRCIDRAVALDAEFAAAGMPGEGRWRRLGLQAGIADALTAGGGDRHWPGVEAQMPAAPGSLDADKDGVLAIYAGLARWHLDHDRAVAAAKALALAEAWIAQDPKYHGKRTVEVGWLTARLAATRGDHATAAAAADRVLAARSSWYGRRRAADCLHLAWRIASSDPAAAGVAEAYRGKALEWYRRVRGALAADVEKDPGDPWFVLPWAVAGVRAAELSAATDVAAATELLAATLPRFDAVRADTPADQWDEAAYGEGKVLQAKLAAAGR
jgi:serine/threonine protein kinase